MEIYVDKFKRSRMIHRDYINGNETKVQKNYIDEINYINVCFNTM